MRGSSLSLLGIHPTVCEHITPGRRAPALVWDDAIAQSAADHASDCWFHHTVNGPYGENLMASWGFDQAKICSSAITGWYEEEQVRPLAPPSHRPQRRAAAAR